ncbi:1,2-phenylacetyl-CoA epoxidase subunit PaaE [Aquimarina hainanensis]|uniref:1,2-phenylacetyl-CoA epoxidase subunit PaaE n=1 Tax=Aquimarina hainanensis TaxID=1578017 RepID=A0ABW5N7G1_9FLAO|nr:1,2-phenylacetyl-CoA epoxidase subunit PaaE [Aquimarina sp. TRL1]QKX03937.1 phenylacetate-CoA oxygenase/reductase subunit PaaK [Aquimarina sp. TRL1]
MNDFYTIKVAEVTKETNECTSLTFDIPQELKEKFAYKQGQYLTLKAMINGEEVRRSYSLCSSPVEDKWQVAVKQIEGGLFSTYACTDIKAGDELEVLPPNGNFYTEVDTTKSKDYIVFAAGSGITPILSIIKTHLAKEPNSTFKLFYLNRTVKSIIFKEEIEALKNTYFGRFEIFYFLTKEHRDIPLLNGRFTSEKLQILASKVIDIKEVDECFICGPEEMIFLIRDELAAAGLPKEKIHYELFFTGGSDADKAKAAKIAEQKFEGTKVTIIDGGKEFHFAMDDEHDNILDGALAAGADLPFACKGGVCSTCKCKVVEGTVEMKINYALEKDEVEKGLVLSCQAVPTAENVVVDFDV